LNLLPGGFVWTGMNDEGLVIDEGRARRLTTTGDERADAFAALADRHLARAYRLASVILGDELEGQDAVQDAAVAAWECVGGLRDRDRFDAWFDRILVNGCRDRLRRRGHVRLIDMDGAPEPASPDGSGSVAERDALRGALAGLSPDHRLIVVLRYYGDLSLDEIAERTGERLGTVKSRLHYGLGALRAAYDAASRLPGEAPR
jgi:RNA polymerase sigma-70 factor (ECF subfamily)